MTMLMTTWDIEFVGCTQWIQMERCGAKPTVAEILKDDWNYCYMKCDEYAGINHPPETYIYVRSSAAANVQLRMASIKLLDREMTSQVADSQIWYALGEAKATLYASLMEFVAAEQERCRQKLDLR